MGEAMPRVVAGIAGMALAACSVAAQAAPELLFQAEAQVLTETCTGQPVRLEGNHNTVTLTGACGSLLLKGFANTVRLGIVPGGSIHVEGSANRVQFVVHGAAPAIVALGPDNDVSSETASLAEPPIQAVQPLTPAAKAPASKAVPPPTLAAPAASLPRSPLTLAGDDQQRLEDCAGRDVTVTGDRSAYVLRGGCKSLTLRGDLLAVQGELASGAKITVAGRGSIVSWVIKGKGRPPATIVRGPGSRVQRAETIVGEPNH